MNVYYSKNIEVADFSNGRVKHAVKESSCWWLKRVLEVTIWSKQIMFMDCLWTTYIFMICNMIYSIFRVNDHTTLTWKVLKVFFKTYMGILWESVGWEPERHIIGQCLGGLINVVPVKVLWNTMLGLAASKSFLGALPKPETVYISKIIWKVFCKN